MIKPPYPRKAEPPDRVLVTGDSRVAPVVGTTSKPEFPRISGLK